MIVVPDASAAAEIVLKRDNAPPLQNAIRNASWVITPHLFIAEIN